MGIFIKKRRYVILIALLLSGTLFFERPGEQVRAASAEPGQYVGDVKLFRGSKKDAVLKAMSDSGYRAFGQNLQSGNKGDFVYLGYKTTWDKEDAITDIRMMDEYGSYDTMDYTQAMERVNKNALTASSKWRTAFSEFRKNVESGSPAAKAAKDILDIVTIRGNKLGDYLLSPDRSEGDFRDILLKANSLMVNFINGQLAMGTAEYGDENWLTRLSSYGTLEVDDGNIEIYEEMYGRKADFLMEQLSDFAEKYRAAEERLGEDDIKGNDEIDSAGEAVDALISEETREKIGKAIEGDTINEKDQDEGILACYRMLKKYPYYDPNEGDTNLGDWFLYLGEGGEDKEAYSMAKAMTEGQYATAGLSSLLQVIMCADTSKEACQAIEEKVPAIKAGMEKAFNGSPDIWAGTNQKLWGEKVGITDELNRVTAASNRYDFLTAERVLDQEQKQWLIVAGAVGGCAMTLLGITMIVTKVVAIAASAATAAAVAGVTLYLTALFGAIMIVAAIVAGFVALLLFVFYKKDEREKRDMPNYMYDAKNNNYLLYELVTDTSGEGVDLNAGKGEEWNALYVTKNKKAGSPLMVDDARNVFCAQEGNNNIPDGYMPLAKFGNNKAANLNEHAEKDKVNGIYTFFRTAKLIGREQTGGEEEEEEEGGEGDVTEQGMYLQALMVSENEKADAARSAIEKKSGYTLIDFNLTSGQEKATFLGYKTTNNEEDAIRDIRVEYSHDQQKYTWGDYSYARAGKIGGKVTLYYSSGQSVDTTDDKGNAVRVEDERPPVLTENLIVTDTKNGVAKGLEPVNLFCGGEAFDVNAAGEDRKEHAYIYFQPEKTFTSGKEYLGGFTFVAVDAVYTGKKGLATSANKDCKSAEDAAEELGLVETGIDVASNYDSNYMDGWLQYAQVGGRIMRLYCSLTHNPYRAVSDAKVFQGENDSTFLMANIENDGKGYSVCNIYRRKRVDEYSAETVPGGYWASHAYWSNQKKETANNFGYVADYRYMIYRVTQEINGDDVRTETEEVDFSEMFFHPLRGLYVCGKRAGKEPIGAEDFKFSGNAECPSGYVPVVNFTDYYRETPVDLNFQTPKHEEWKAKTDPLYMFVKAEGLTKPEKKTYIQSIHVISDETENFSTDLAMYGLLRAGGDEIFMHNLASLNDLVYTEADEIFAGRSDDYMGDDDNKSAYIRVTRTDKKARAIGSILIVPTTKDDSRDENHSFDYDGMRFTRAGDKIHDKGDNYFYLYTSNSGNAIKELTLEESPVSYNGMADQTTVTAGVKDGELDPKRSVYLSYKTAKPEKQLYVTDIKVVEGKVRDARAQIKEWGGSNITTVNLNKGNTGKNLYLGYKTSEKEEDALTGIAVAYGKNPEGSADFDGVAYEKASDIDLNKGVAGNYIYIYKTKDKSAGRPLIEIRTTVDGSSWGGGYRYVKCTDGSIGNMNAGALGDDIYVQIKRYGEDEAGYVSDVKIVDKDWSEAREELKNWGADEILDTDLNKGAPGPHIYLGYKTTTDPDKGIRRFGVYYGKEHSQTESFGGKSYNLVEDLDLNKKAGGKYIYLYATKDKDLGAPIEAVYGTTEKSNYGNGYCYIRSSEDLIANFNRGTIGSNIYLVCKKEDAGKEADYDENQAAYIKEVALVTGDWEEAVDKVRDWGGSQVVGLDLNKGVPGPHIYLGYKLTNNKSEAITDLRALHTKNHDSAMKVNGISYTLVKEQDLNAGNSGDYIYLYYTKSTDAGKPVTRIDGLTTAGGTVRGGYYMKRTDDAISELNSGTVGPCVYLALYTSGTDEEEDEKENDYYVYSIHAVKNGRDAAKAELKRWGCDVFIDMDMNKGNTGSSIFIGYKTTTNRNYAVTDVRVTYKKKKNSTECWNGNTYWLTDDLDLNRYAGVSSEYVWLYYSKSAGAGKPVVSLGASTGNQALAYNQDYVKTNDGRQGDMNKGALGPNIYLVQTRDIKEMEGKR